MENCTDTGSLHRGCDCAGRRRYYDCVRLWVRLLGVVYRGTQEAFGVRQQNFNDQEIPEQLAELHTLMQDYGFPDNLLPTYLPEGFGADFVKRESNTTFVKLLCYLSKNDDSFILDYTMYQNSQVTEEAQKDGDDPDAVVLGGVTHYIMTNDQFNLWRELMKKNNYIVFHLPYYYSYDKLYGICRRSGRA